MIKLSLHYKSLKQVKGGLTLGQPFIVFLSKMTTWDILNVTEMCVQLTGRSIICHYINVAKENTRIKHVIYKLTDDLKKTTKQTETIRNQYSGTLFLFNSDIMAYMIFVSKQFNILTKHTIHRDMYPVCFT